MGCARDAPRALFTRRTRARGCASTGTLLASAKRMITDDESRYASAIVNALFDVLEHALASDERDTATAVAAQLTEIVAGAQARAETCRSDEDTA